MVLQKPARTAAAQTEFGLSRHLANSSIQQVTLVEISFHSGTEMGQAIGQVVAVVNWAKSRMSPGTLPL